MNDYWQGGDSEGVVNYEANVKAVDARGDAALCEAVTFNQVDVARLLLKKGVVKVINERNTPPLIIAVRVNNLDMVRLLLEHGPDMELNDALEITAKAGHYKVAQALFDYGANVEGRSDEGGPLVAAVKGGDDVVRLFLDHKANPTAAAFLEAATQANLPMLKLLLERGAPISAKVEGRTALHCAVEKGLAGMPHYRLLH